MTHANLRTLDNPKSSLFWHIDLYRCWLCCFRPCSDQSCRSSHAHTPVHSRTHNPPSSLMACRYLMEAVSGEEVKTELLWGRVREGHRQA